MANYVLSFRATFSWILPLYFMRTNKGDQKKKKGSYIKLLTLNDIIRNK